MDAVAHIPRRWVQALSGGIGPRRSGSQADARAAQFVEDEFGRLFPQVERRQYRFLGWRPGREGQLTLDGERLPTRVGIGCPPTCPEGVAGVLRRCGVSDTFGLWEPGRGGPSAHLLAYTGPGGQAIPLLWSPCGAIPAGIVGADLASRLAQAAAAGAPVRFACDTALDPGAVSWNIEGILPGDPQRWVFVVGHYDTVYPSPGANDNTASTACLPAIAACLRGVWGPPRPTLRFLATGGEEIDLQGARARVRDLEWSGDAAKVVLVLNFDSLTWGDDLALSVRGAEAALPSVVEAIGAARFGSYSGAHRVTPLSPAGGVDSVPFANAGLPTLNVNTEGDAATTALWHTPQDTPERVPWGRVDDAVALFADVLLRLEPRPG